MEVIICARLRRFWQGEWVGLWMEARAEGIGRGREKSAESDATRMEALARRVELLLKEGQESKATGCAVRSGVLASGTDVAAQLQALFPPTCPHNPPSHPADLSEGDSVEELWDRMANGIASQIKKFPRLASPGPSGSRFEHWSTLRYLEGAARDAGEVLASLALGRGPADARAAFLSRKLIALQKKQGGLRPIAGGSITRRLVAKTLCRLYQADIRAHVGLQQFEVGRPAGVEQLHKVLSVQAQRWDSAVVLSFDASNAFNTISRSAVREALVATIPGLSRACGWWYSQPTSHLFWDEHQHAHTITAERGVDQGCPLSPALFSLALAPKLAALEASLRARDDRTRVYAYLDDIFLVCDAAEAEVAAEGVRKTLAELSMSINESKTKVWSLNPSVPLPPSMVQFRAARMTCLGAVLPFMPAGRISEGADDGEVSRAPLLESIPGEAHLHHLRGVKQRIRDLQTAGLSNQAAFSLFRTYVNGAVTHLQRANLTDQTWCMAWDAEVLEMISGWVDTPLDASQRVQVFLPVREGGLGLGATEARRAAAYLGSWEQCLSAVASAGGSTTSASLLSQAPRSAASIHEAQTGLQQQGVHAHVDWESRMVRPQRRRQRQWTREVQETMHARLLSELPELDAADLRSAGGAGAGAFLLSPTDDVHQLPDSHFCVALRRRLRIRRGTHGHCRRKYKQTGSACSKPLDGQEVHARTCKVGGAIDRRHDRIRDWLAQWISRMVDKEVQTEQYVPKWDRTKTNARGEQEVERARLDIAFQGRAGPVYLDIAITEAITASARALSQRARVDGAAAAHEEQEKHWRYPGPNLIPFVLEAGGRFGESAESFLRSVTPKDLDDRAAEISAAKQALSCLLQLGNAEVLLGATA